LSPPSFVDEILLRKIRTRWEANGQSGGGAFQDSSAIDDFIATQVRLNATANINDTTSAFIQMQSSRVWGEDLGTDGTAANAGGADSASFTASDSDASVGLHQAYFTIKNFATLPASLKVGRQEIVLDGHRLFGHTGWTTVGGHLKQFLDVQPSNLLAKWQSF
jgi:hypothetical protein